jgi:hypothetical protein
MAWQEGTEFVANIVDFMGGKIVPNRTKYERNEAIADKQLAKISNTNVEKPAQKTLICLDSESKSVVKVEPVLPQLGNAKLEATRRRKCCRL